ncbi:MAG: hypothetical protein AAB921_01260 [Patescibacteria group bacterium]
MAATISATARKAIDIRLIDARNALSTKERFETPATTPCLFAFARHSRNPEARILALTTLIARAGHTLQKQDRDLWEQIKSVLETYFEKDSIPNHILDRFRYDGPTNGLRIWAHGVLHKREKVAAEATRVVPQQPKAAEKITLNASDTPPARKKGWSKPHKGFGDLPVLLPELAQAIAA